jgi:hypothetical protein
MTRERGQTERLPSKSTDLVRVDFPEPFGPAIIVRVGTLPQAACAVNSRMTS